MRARRFADADFNPINEFITPIDVFYYAITW